MSRKPLTRKTLTTQYYDHTQQNEHVIFIDLLSGWRQDRAGRGPGSEWGPWERDGGPGSGMGPESEMGVLGAQLDLVTRAIPSFSHIK